MNLNKIQRLKFSENKIFTDKLFQWIFWNQVKMKFDKIERYSIRFSKIRLYFANFNKTQPISNKFSELWTIQRISINFSDIRLNFVNFEKIQRILIKLDLNQWALYFIEFDKIGILIQQISWNTVKMKFDKIRLNFGNFNKTYRVTNKFNKNEIR